MHSPAYLFSQIDVTLLPPSFAYSWFILIGARYKLKELADGMKQVDFHTEIKYDSVSFSSWAEKIKNLSTENCKDFQEKIQKLIPIIFNLGGKEAIAEVATAIQDVGRWWR